jgi:predicted dehydrogenase
LQVHVANQPLRVAVVGLGLWGARAHLPAFNGHADVDVVALVDERAEVAAALAHDHGIARSFADIRALFEAVPDLDAVVIATPTDTHAELVRVALAAGVHVLCEKPLGYDLGQARAMVGAMRAADRIGKMGFLFRYSPAAQHMKQCVDDGYLGDLQLFESVTVNAQFADPARPRHWKMQRSRANGGVFVEYGSHSIDLAQWFGGPIERVVAHGVTLIPNRPTQDGCTGAVDVDDASSWIGAYASGGEALFRTGWASLPIGGTGVRVYGPRGALAWQQEGNRRTERVIGCTLEHPAPRVLFEFEPAYDPQLDEGAFPLGLLARYNQRLVESFVADIRAQRASGPTFEVGLAAQEVLAAIRVSLDEARWVTVERA